MDSSTIRSFTGCWTCRLRRKKCDENRPSCDVCSALMITCHFDTAKPEWMDGGAQQDAMAEALKIEVKENAHRRRTVPSLGGGQRMPLAKPVNAGCVVAPLHTPASPASPTPISLSGGSASNVRSNGLDCTLAGIELKGRMTIGRSDACLVMFYLENLFPFLFPFYRPALLQGGRTWILEMMISSPVVKQALLCQSSYFLSLAKGRTNWDTILEQTRDAFEVLRRSLQVIGDAGVTEHLHGAVRILASVIQVQRFEIAILSFNNCRAHLNAAVALFTQLLESAEGTHLACPSTNLNAVLEALNPTTGGAPTELFQVPNAEQSAFRFSSTLLILDDIIAATILREQPRLYHCHRSLLYTSLSFEAVINMEEVVGCQNWVLFYVSEIATLDAWKQHSHRAKSLDVMELVQRASTIKHRIEEHLLELETVPANEVPRPACLLDIISSDFGQQARAPVGPTSLATRIWAHAALIYLFVVVSGWQPANSDVRYHTGKVTELLSQPTMPPALLRSMVWPFCVAGCLAAPEQEAQFREMVQVLQPSTVFGTVHKALEIMEYAWMNRLRALTDMDLATCFKSQGDLVLLV